MVAGGVLERGEFASSGDFAFGIGISISDTVDSDGVLSESDVELPKALEDSVSIESSSPATHNGLEIR